MTEKKLNLEEEILNATKATLIAGIKALDGYHNPTKSIVESIIREYEPSLSLLFKDAIEKTIRSDNFKEELQKLISQRIVRELVCQSESSIAKIVQKMKQDETFRARLTLAVDNIVTEFTGK